MDCVVAVEEIPVLVSFCEAARSSDGQETDLLAKDMWQVKHLYGFTFVSIWYEHWHQREQEGSARLTGQDVSLEVLVACEGLTTVCAKGHCCL